MLTATVPRRLAPDPRLLAAPSPRMCKAVWPKPVRLSIGISAPAAIAGKAAAEILKARQSSRSHSSLARFSSPVPLAIDRLVALLPTSLCAIQSAGETQYLTRRNRVGELLRSQKSLAGQ